MDLFASLSPVERLDDGAALLRGFVLAAAEPILAAVDAVAAAAPFRNMVTPGGFTMSAAMTACGAAGWITDRRGYRYTTDDPLTGLPWPAMPPLLHRLAVAAAAAAGYGDFHPDACLINRYAPGARMSPHQDKDEARLGAPVVSFSFGIPATFLWGGAKRCDKYRRIALEHGDAVVWGGATRLAFHGIAPLPKATHPLTGAQRINLTFREAL